MKINIPNILEEPITDYERYGLHKDVIQRIRNENGVVFNGSESERVSYIKAIMRVMDTLQSELDTTLDEMEEDGIEVERGEVAVLN